jgi:hypothetical protein
MCFPEVGSAGIRTTRVGDKSTRLPFDFDPIRPDAPIGDSVATHEPQGRRSRCAVLILSFDDAYLRDGKRQPE